MSHFSVLVIGADHDAALAPFHEFECTGINDEYVQDIDITGEVGSVENLDDHGLEDKVVDDASKVNIQNEHQYGYAIVKDGVLVKAVRRTNPNRKWDWYVVGGRWSRQLLLKDGLKSDQARVGDIDWDGMLAPLREDAGKTWDAITQAIAQHPPLQSFQDIQKKLNDDVVAGVTAKLTGEELFDQARNIYHAQPLLKSVRESLDPQSKSFFFDFGSEIEQVQKFNDRAAYVDFKAGNGARTYALLHEGQWLQPGEMGWFGMSDKTADSEVTFNTKFWETVRALPKDEIVTVVDCHI